MKMGCLKPCTLVFQQFMVKMRLLLRMWMNHSFSRNASNKTEQKRLLFGGISSLELLWGYVFILYLSCVHLFVVFVTPPMMFC